MTPAPPCASGVAGRQRARPDYDSGGRRLGQTLKRPGQAAVERPYAADASGSVEALEEPDGTTGGERYLYDPYGESENVAATPGATAEPGLSERLSDNPSASRASTTTPGSRPTT